MDLMMRFAIQQMFQPVADAVTFAAGLAMLIYFAISLYQFIYQTFR
jgi:hypothetical protein